MLPSPHSSLKQLQQFYKKYVALKYCIKIIRKEIKKENNVFHLSQSTLVVCFIAFSLKSLMDRDYLLILQSLELSRFAQCCFILYHSNKSNTTGHQLGKLLIIIITITLSTVCLLVTVLMQANVLQECEPYPTLDERKSLRCDEARLHLEHHLDSG